MATLGASVLTLAEFARRTGPDGMPQRMANVLSQSSPAMRDAVWIPSNLPTSNRSTIVTGLPVVRRRRFNAGVAPSRGTTSQITDTMELLEARSHVDAKELEVMGNAAQHRVKEGRLFLESMAQTAETDFFFGDEGADPEEFNGLIVRPNYTSLGDNALGAGGTGSDLTSIWLVGWGEGKISMLYPKNTTMGLRHMDRGLQEVQDATGISGAMFTAWVDTWTWDLGLCVEDGRYAVRIANIEDEDVLGVSGTQELTDYTTNIMFLMTRALHRIPNRGAVKLVFYMARTIFEGFDVQALARTTPNVFQTRQVDGETVTTFRGVPIKISDAIGYTEAAIT